MNINKSSALDKRQKFIIIDDCLCNYSLDEKNNFKQQLTSRNEWFLTSLYPTYYLLTNCKN
jgi:hypothetical protein